MDLEAVVAVTKPSKILVSLGLLLLSISSEAAVLPAERADVLFHSYSGGGIDITGPALLVRSNVGDSISVSAKHYVDTISSASIDVEVILGASTYEEERVENGFTADYLNEKTLLSFSYTNSEENDFSADTFSIGVSQDFFGDLTTLSMGYARGDNVVGKTGTPAFSEVSSADVFDLGITQVITKNLIMQAALNLTTDAGFLNNPYRKVRYIDPANSSDFLLEDEIYPDTRTSTAIAVRARYFLPYRAALHAEFRTFEDSWGIKANNFEIGYTHSFLDDWVFEAHYRAYSQTKADFYSDLFPFQTAQNFIARDKELSTFNDTTIGFGISYEFANGEGGSIDKASINLKFDHIEFVYDDFRDARDRSFVAGTEPLYQFNANVMQLFLSVWF